VIYKSSTVNIDRYRDEALKGISSLPSVSVYIQSMAKYDATTPLTLNYEKLSGYTVQVPLYAYRSHGNGRVASFTSSLTGSWTSGWSAEDKAALLGNILTANTPPAKVDYPFTLTVEPGSLDTYVEIVPSILNPDAKVNVRLVPPSGLATNRALSFDSRKYYYTFPTSEVGSYKLEVTYAYDDKSFTARSYFDISYLPEYNAFAAFDKTAIYQFMKGNGTISEDGIPSLENDEGDIATYKVSYTVPLLIAAAVLFLVDIATRTIKLKDRRTRQKEREVRMKIRKESGK